MTQLTRCPEGHFYDGNKFRVCPYCQQAGGPVRPTMPMTPPSAPTPPVRPAASPAASPAEPDEMNATVGYYDNMPKAPVTGWLVIIGGPGKGQDFRLRPGRNYIGRAGGMDVVLDGDPMVSRNKHAIIVFDPVSRSTLCQPGESRELFYLNGQVVMEAARLKRGDVLSIGKTKLAFVPFCDENFAWDESPEET